MVTLDLKQDLKHLYKPSPKQAEIVDVPPANYLMIDGSGDPNNSPDYQAAIEALYGAAYSIMMGLKKSGQADYPIMPLEGLWWTEGEQFSYDERGNWRWTLMILQPDVVTEALLDEARKKKNTPAMSRLRLERLHEGQSAQIMHVGPYSAEPPTIERLHTFIADKGCSIRDKHHEIYLSDARRTAPEKLKTIIRYPIAVSR